MKRTEREEEKKINLYADGGETEILRLEMSIVINRQFIFRLPSARDDGKSNANN